MYVIKFNLASFLPIRDWELMKKWWNEKEKNLM